MAASGFAKWQWTGSEEGMARILRIFDRDGLADHYFSMTMKIDVRCWFQKRCDDEQGKHSRDDPGALIARGDADHGRADAQRCSID